MRFTWASRRGYLARWFWISGAAGADSLGESWRAERPVYSGLLAAFAPESGAHWRGGHGHERSLLRGRAGGELPGVPGIVFDRYHVIQLMNQRVDALRREELVREATGPR